MNYALETIKRTVDNAEANHQQVREDYAEDVKQYGVVYAAEWSHKHVGRELEAELWVRVAKRRENGTDVVDALDAEVQRCKEQILNDYHGCTSTSMFANAVSEARRAAYAGFVRTNESLVAAARDED